MAKRHDSFYFKTFIDCMECACRASDILNDTLRNFDKEQLKSRLDEIHKEEHAADCFKHDMLAALIKEFITPIEREDIIQLSQNIDEVVDAIDDVLLRIYCNNIVKIRPDALKLSQMIVNSCLEVKRLMIELPDFKKSKTIHKRIININTMEEEADALFIFCLRTLHTTSNDPIEILSWHELYMYLEKCMDACEHVADIVETIMMKNS